MILLIIFRGCEIRMCRYNEVIDCVSKSERQTLTFPTPLCRYWCESSVVFITNTSSSTYIFMAVRNELPISKEVDKPPLLAQFNFVITVWTVLLFRILNFYPFEYLIKVIHAQCTSLPPPTDSIQYPPNLSPFPIPFTLTSINKKITSQ